MTIKSGTKAVAAAVLLPILAGCTAQVNNTALNMQESYKTLLMKQILFNLGEAERDGSQFFPSQILVTAGSAQSSNTVAPSFSLPLPGMTTGASISATPTTTTLGSTQSIAWGAPGLSLGISDSWTLNWGLTPRNDPDELSRLRALYRFATGNIEPGCSDRTAADDWLKRTYVMQGGTGSVNPAFTQKPNCILCQPRPELVEQKTLSVNPALQCGFISTTAKEGFTPLDRYGTTQFYVAGGREHFIHFVFFVLEAMSNTAYAQYTVKPPTSASAGTTDRSAPAPAPLFIPGPQPPKTQSAAPFSLPL